MTPPHGPYGRALRKTKSRPQSYRVPHSGTEPRWLDELYSSVVSRRALLTALIGLLALACERRLGPPALTGPGEPQFLAGSSETDGADYWLATCRLRVTGVTGSSVDVDVAGLPGNRMKQYGNYIAVWQGAIVPWGQPPLAQQAIEVTGESGSVAITGLDVTRLAYIVAYGVGNGASGVCATDIIPASAGDRGAPPDYLASPEHVSLALASVTPSSIDVTYTTFAGYLPASAGNWLGLWQGRYSPFNPATPLAKLNVPRDLSDGRLRLEGLKLDPEAGYTLVYFVGASNTSAAALLYFDAAKLLAPSPASARGRSVLQALSGPSQLR